MVHPFLDGTLHAHLHQPVHIIGCSLVVGRLSHQLVHLLLRIALRGVHAVHLHPFHELGVIDKVFLERVAHLVHIVHMYVGVVGVHLAATGIDGQEDGFDATGGLCHERRGSSRSNGQTGNVSASALHHVGIECGVCVLDAPDEGVVLLALGIVYLEGAALLGHLYAGSVSVQRQRLVHLHAEVGSLLGAVAQSHGSYHVALGSDAHAGTTAFRALGLDFLPQVHLGAFHLHGLRVALYLLHDEVYLLQLQVHDVVHQSLGHLYVLLEQLVVEVCFLGEGVPDIRVEVDAQQSAGVVGTQGYLAAGVRRYGTETEVCITVGDALPEDGVPEEHTGLGALPCVVYDLLPECLCTDFPPHVGVVARNGELLYVGLVLSGRPHELVVYLHAHVGTRHLAFGHLGIDESLRVGMLDAHTQHQRATTTVLCHLARTITISLHEGHQTGRGQRRVVNRRALRTDMAQVVTHTAAALHELHLLLVNAHHGTV